MDKKMYDINCDIKSDIQDHGESVSQMEPMLIGEGSSQRGALTDRAFELAQKSAGFRYSLPAGIVAPLADLVRAMNCYYSNQIEGHNTHPVEIEQALKNEYSDDPQKRILQREAKAHIEVQRWIDAGGLRGRATTRAGICEVHRRFCNELPDELLWVENPETHERVRVVPGELRHCDVKVGRHVPVSPGALPRFLDRFEAVYTPLGKTDSILGAAAAHHRLAWIHPFLDGNGRVVRLMSHATLLETLDTGALWSVARGLARNVDAYRDNLMNCDQGRRDNFDGRGNLSEATLIEFTRFFLDICIDQVAFMEKLMQPDQLRGRILLWAEEQARLQKLSAKAGTVLRAVLFQGEITRGEIPGILNTGFRQAQRIVADLVKMSVLASETPLGPLRITFPAELAPRWMPGLFPVETATKSFTADAFLRKGS
jgi:Fic family protein